jgi:tetratricopeptide (TPR) repeat protein
MRQGLLWAVTIACAFAAAPQARSAPSPSAARAERLRTVLATLGQAEQAVRSDLPSEARALYAQAEALAQALGEPNLPLARAIDGLADLDRAEGLLDDAARRYARAASMWPVLLGDGQPRLATTLHNLGAVYLAQGRLDEADRAFSQALSIWEETLGSGSAEAEQARQARERVQRSARSALPLDGQP